MAESPEPGRRAAAGGALLDGEDEEREPLLPRIAWAQPRKSAPGTAVRMVEAARKEGGAASLSAIDEKLLFGPKDSPRCPSLDLGLPRSLPTHRDGDHSLGSGGTRLSRSPRDPPRPRVAAQLPSPGPRSGLPRRPPALFCVSH